MAAFSFNLQPLLSVKLQLEESLKNELGKATQELEKQKQILLGFEREKEACMNDFKTKSAHLIKVNDIKSINVYIAHLSEKILHQKENVNYAQNIVDKVREDLVKVVQEREMLEKLKENKYESYMLEQFKAEQKLNDEIVSYKHGGYKTED